MKSKKSNAIKKLMPALLLGASSLALCTNAIAAPAAKAAPKTMITHNAFVRALIKGKWDLGLRARYEHVRQDNALKTARAITLQTLLGYRTGKFHGFSAYGQLEAVTRLSPRTYNSGMGTSPSKIRYSLITDPSMNIVNQLYLDFDTVYKTRLRAGRQVINLDNQRFVGSVGFRQNDQTFDAIGLQNTFLPGLKVFYAYVNRVNRIFGPNATMHQDAQNNNTNFFNVSYSKWHYGTFTAYDYLIDNDKLAGFSTNSYGLRFHGTAPTHIVTFIYTLEYALQNDAYNNKTAYSAHYAHIGLGVTKYGVMVRADQETLSGSKYAKGKAFRTPYATLHKFQGWNDVFLVTPSSGIVDSYITVKAIIQPLHGLVLAVIGHNFASEASSKHFGKEVDAMASKDWFKHRLTTSVMYGDFYGARAPYVDTKKVWLTVGAHFTS